MKTLKMGEQPDKHYTVSVQVREVTPAYRVGATGFSSPTVVDREVEEAFTVTVRAENYEDALRVAEEHLNTAREAGRE